MGSEVLLLMLMLLPDVTLELRNEKWFLSFNSVMGLHTYIVYIYYFNYVCSLAFQ